MASITQTIPQYIGGISQQPDEKKLPGQLVTAKNVLPDVTEGLMKRPGSKLVSSLSDGTLTSSTNGKWFHYYRDETEQYIGQINREGTVRMWDCATGSEKTVTNNLTSTSNDGTYSRDTSGVITVTLADHGLSLGEIVNLDFTTGTAVDDNYTITEVIDADNFKVKDSTTSSTSGAVTIKTNYLYNINDADLQTLTLNDYTYITNRTKVTAMKDLLSGSYDGENNYNSVRDPEAFVELRKVAYANQYALNIYDDTTLEDVTTATRISIKREIDSSNSCQSANPDVFPPSGTLPNSGVYTGECLNTNSKNEDGYCPNIETRIFNFTLGAAWDSADSNGVAGNFTFFRNGSEQVLYETQTLAISGVGSNKVYRLTGDDITDMTLPATDSSATIAELVTLIKSHSDYAGNTFTISSQSITAGQPEIQTIALGSSSWNYGASNETVLTINDVSISIRASSCNLSCQVLKLQQHADYDNLAATIALDGTDVIVTYKNNGTYSMATMQKESGAIVTATRTQESIENDGTLRIVFKTSGDKAGCTLENVTDSTSQAFTQINPSSNLSLEPKDLYFRITTTGQAVAESNDSDPIYRCRYTTTHDLLYGGQNWLVGDYFYVWMKNAKYKITIDKISTARVQANRGLIRPAPTSFDTKTVVTAESILGDLRAGIDADDNSNFNEHTDGRLNSAGAYVSGVKQIGNGLHITRPTGTFNVNSPSPDLLNVFTNEIQDIAELPSQCVNGYTVKIRNSEATEDDYFVRFIADNGRDGTGVWEECPEPGRKIAFDEHTMPIQLVRNADGTFTLDEIDWQICIAGNTVTVPEPSFIGKNITKMMFWRNRMLLLSDENVIMSQPGEYFNYWPKSSITYTASDVIDISVSSEFPAIIYDGALTNSGLILFSKNQQYLLTTDSDVLSPQTAKINTISTYNFNSSTNPISLGTTIAFLDDAGNYSRFWEMSGAERSGDPNVIEQTKIASKLLTSDIELISNSRENSIIFFSKKNSSTLYGYKYFDTSEKRLQQAWFTWEITGTIQHHAILDDTLYIVVRNNGKDTLQRFSIKMHTDTITITDDKSNVDATDDEIYRIHLDTASAVTIAAGTYNENSNKTTFPKPDGYENTTAQLCLYDNNTTSDYVGKYSTATIVGSNIEAIGDWSDRTVILGYLYDMQIEFPTIYYTQTVNNIIKVDTNGSLIVHRIKLNFGPYGSYTTTIDKLGNSSYEETWEAPISDQYLLSNVAIDDEVTRTIPIYERNKNLTINLKSSHPSPATLYSMAWEGDFTNKFYQRV